jgi:hypothetical protein
MRENALPILEQAGVDLVLTGHSHSYERSFLIDGHYDTSDTFTSAMVVDGGSGRESGSGAYIKQSSNLAPHEGAVYAVAGSSGQIEGGSLNHPAMYVSMSVLGSMILQINSNRLDAKFIDSTGATRDFFTVLKGDQPTQTLQAPANLTATAVSSSRINLTWQDLTTNEAGFKIERSTNNSTFTQVASVGPNITTFANTGLASNVTYYYRVRAYNSTTNSPYSNTANAKTFAGQLPTAPSNLVAQATSTSRILLTWRDNSNNESGFKVERSADGANFTQIAILAANLERWANTGLVRNKRYWYRIRAYNASGNSAYSNKTSAVTFP